MFDSVVLTCVIAFLLDRFSPPHPLKIILLKILRCQAAKVESVIAEGGASRFRYAFLLYSPTYIFTLYIQ